MPNPPPPLLDREAEAAAIACLDRCFGADCRRMSIEELSHVIDRLTQEQAANPDARDVQDMLAITDDVLSGIANDEEQLEHPTGTVTGPPSRATTPMSRGSAPSPLPVVGTPAHWAAQVEASRLVATWSASREDLLGELAALSWPRTAALSRAGSSRSRRKLPGARTWRPGSRGMPTRSRGATGNRHAEAVHCPL